MEHASVPRHRPLAFDKMESLIKEMQDPETGVPVRCQKLFLSVIPSAFMGYDLVEWLMERFNLEENANVEAINLANQLCQYGYFFPVNDSKNLVLKDDSSLYRFQSPYYWPWQTTRVAGSGSSAPSLGPDNVEYAIYLVKRTLRNKQRHALEEYEQEALANLKKNLAGKWDFITMQAEEQVRLAKDRKKGDKVVSDSQERAYWRVARPPPGVTSALEPCPVPVRARNARPKKRTIEQVQREIEHLKASLDRTRVKTSIALEALLAYSETFAPYDPWLTAPQPSNPWISDDTLFWQINSPLVDVPSEKRVQRWAMSIEELVSDPTGLQEFTSFLRKEYSHENIRFWLAVMDLRRSSTKQIQSKLDQIYEEFLKPGAPCEINIDGATADKVAEGLRSRSRYAFDHAADHVYGLLLKKDCYPRFVRSDHFQRLLAEGKNVHQKKAKFFNFGSGQVKKKPGATSGPLSRRRGSDRSLTGSAHELAACAVQPQRAPEPPPHSHSQSNLADIPFRDPLDDSVDDAVPWESVTREAVYGSGVRRRQDSAADSGSSSSDVSACVIERARRLPQQSTLDGGLRGAPPPLRRLSAVEPRHLSAVEPRTLSGVEPRPQLTMEPRAAASPPPSPRPPAGAPHPTPTISVSSAPDDDSPSGAGSPERRSLAHTDEPSSVFASADATPTEPGEPGDERRGLSFERTASGVSGDSRTDINDVEVKSEESPAAPAPVAVPERVTRVARDDSRDSDRSTADDVAASTRGAISREPSTTRELSPASSKDSSKIGDLPGDGPARVDALREVRPVDTPAPQEALSQAVEKRNVLESISRPAPVSAPCESKIANAAESSGPEPTPSAAPPQSAPLLPQQQTARAKPVPSPAQSGTSMQISSSAQPEPGPAVQQGTSMPPLKSEKLAQPQPLKPEQPQPERPPQPMQPVQSSDPAPASTVAPLAVGEDIGVDDDNVDKVPSAPVQRVSGNSRTASESDAMKRIAHKDELSSVSDSDIVKRDNKSELAERPQRNDICPWEDENSCESDAPFVKTYATLGYL